MKTIARQLELKLGSELRKRITPVERRRARAEWWFAQMRRVVEATEPAVPSHAPAVATFHGMAR
ncbi:MAG: hypothetical protein RMN51_00565 [Verrucomicrobiota bacterium]|nr:hypothetical protein [Limisphaera sp.]MDW8380592.1 hypothetical protein [Verrucomicrobiota bacterium]